MVCRGCGDKKSRHGEVVVGDVDARPASKVPVNIPGAETPGAGFAKAPAENAANQQDPLAAFISAKSMSYEDMKERKRLQYNFLTQQEEQIMSEMTDAMRRIHVEELVNVANFEKMGIPGMTPEQAVVALKESLERPDFKGILSYFPGLKAAVDLRWEELQNKLLPVT